MKYFISMQENNDEDYKQIIYSNEYFNNKNDFLIEINLSNRSYLFLLIIFILTSQTNALPIPQDINSSYIQQPSVPYKIYRPIPSYANQGSSWDGMGPKKGSHGMTDFCLSRGMG
jgi:hypothetical protein